MKPAKMFAFVIGLLAGILWLVFGIMNIPGARVVPLLLEGLLVGGAVVISVFVAWRFGLPGGVLLICEGIMPFILMFLMARGFPVFPSVLAGMTIVSGVIFLVALARYGPQD
jgi:hypothetical protein